MFPVLVFFLLSIHLRVSVCQILLFGNCENVETMEYFELERFLGKWYEIQRIPTWYEDHGQCSYKLIQRCDRRIEFQHAFVKDNIQYVLHVNSTYVPGDKAVFDIQKNNIDPFGVPLSITTTDYTNYAIMYGCTENQTLAIKYVQAWILSRNTTLSPELLDEAHQKLKLIPSTSLAYFQPVSQNETQCQYSWSAHVQASYYNKTDNDGLTN